MKIRPFNVDKMRRHAARSTPDRITKVITIVEAENETAVRRLFTDWMDKMRIKHLGKRKRIEFFQEYDIDRNAYRVAAQVVDDPYAHPIRRTA